MLENRVLKRIFGPKGDKLTGEWRRLHNEELYALYSSPNIIRVTKSRRSQWAGHVARMKDRKYAYKKERDRLKDGVYGRTILKWKFKK
jgi:hypothetical protein